MEGRHLIREALGADWPLDAVLVRGDRWDEWREALEGETDQGRVSLAPATLVGRLSLQPAPEGILALARRTAPPWPEGGVRERFLYLDSVQDPVNTGILIRSAKAFGFDGVFAGEGTADAFKPQALGRTAGAAFRLPIWPCRCETFLDWAQARGVALLAANARGTPLSQVTMPVGPFALVMGNEGRGLSPQLLERCTRRVAIPMSAGWDSLNVAAAGTVLMQVFSNVDPG